MSSSFKMLVHVKMHKNVNQVSLILNVSTNLRSGKSVFVDLEFYALK